MYESVESFERPANLRETLRLLEGAKGRARVVAGGKTDGVQADDGNVRILIDISNAGLNYVRAAAGALAIGSATTLADLADDIPAKALAGGLLVKALEHSGSMQNRNLSTVGGKIAANSAPELTTTLLALEADVVVAEGKGRRTMGLADYLALPKNTRASTLLIEILVPKPPRTAGTAWSFLRLGITALDASIVTAAAGLQLGTRGRVKWVRLAVCSTSIPQVEALLANRSLDAALLEESGAVVASAVPAVADHRATAEYRREMSRLLSMRVLRECAIKTGWAI